MRQDSTRAEAAIALPAAGQLGTKALPLPRLRAATGPIAGRIALCSLLLCTLAVAVWASAGPSLLVPRSEVEFPGWIAGPLHGIFGHLSNDPMGVSLGLTGAVLAMCVAYVVALGAVRSLSMRAIVVCVVAMQVLMLLGPPMQLTDVFNYLGYARLGALHGLNPYSHVIANVAHDPIYRLTTWRDLRSPYGPAFTAATYPLAFLPIPVAFWVIKFSVGAASLGLVAIVRRIALQLGRDPRFAVLFVAANPITVIYAVGAFHNDFFMLMPGIGAIALLLARRDRLAGAALMLAVFVKFTAILLLPFLLIAARPRKRRGHVLAGAAIAAVPLALATFALFGSQLPNLADQSTLLTELSVPNLLGGLLGLGGGSPELLRALNVSLVVVGAYLVLRKGDWLTGMGWATLALLASLAWLMPWYITWLLPLAALAGSVRLRRATLAFAAFLVLTFVPATGIVLSRLHIDPMAGSAAHASSVRERSLAG
jgi:uncharacterized membrane protein